MSSVPIPQLPLFRVTLFYGPEPAEDDPARLTCVFNVKKRSWKGGVQVAVEVSMPQVTRLQQAVEFDEWIEAHLSEVPTEERSAYGARARDCFMQEVCSMKLTYALEQEVGQNNACVPFDKFMAELDQNIEAAGDRIKSHILMELDLTSAEGGMAET